MEVTIREADAGDATGLEILRGQAIKATYQDEYDRTTVGDLVATVDADLSPWIDHDRYLVVVAETEITPVSYAVLDREEGELLSIVTSPDYRREGFASQLLKRVESAAREDGHEMLDAVAPEPTTDFFETVGFDRVEETAWHDIVAARLRKALPGPETESSK
jgi:GNAT superfamily N-acetyltransferase